MQAFRFPFYPPSEVLCTFHHSLFSCICYTSRSETCIYCIFLASILSPPIIWLSGIFQQSPYFYTPSSLRNTFQSVLTTCRFSRQYHVPPRNIRKSCTNMVFQPLRFLSSFSNYLLSLAADRNIINSISDTGLLLSFLFALLIALRPYHSPR